MNIVQVIPKMAILLGLLLQVALQVNGQTAYSLELDSCYAWAEKNYPAIRQYNLIEKSTAYSIENAQKGYFPQIQIAGQATYQSEVTSLPISLPNVDIPQLSKDQYKLYAEINQPITDLFTVKNQLELVQANAEIEQQKVKVELYSLKNRINQLFFGVLLIDAQIRQNELLKKDIQTGIDNINAAIEFGVALRSSADELQAELLKVNQMKIELLSNRKGYMEMLSLFINHPIDSETEFQQPWALSQGENIRRPELELFALQKRTFDIQRKLVESKNLPRFNFFFQGGLGRPALNFLSNDIKGYFITGIRLNWNLTSFYTNQKEREILTLSQNMLDIQQETFLFNTRLTMRQQNAEIEKLRTLVESDAEIIALREKIKISTQNQLENGTATSRDYLSALNAEDQAKQSQLLHRIQFILAQYNYQNSTGNE